MTKDENIRVQAFGAEFSAAMNTQLMRSANLAAEVASLQAKIQELEDRLNKKKSPKKLDGTTNE